MPVGQRSSSRRMSRLQHLRTSEDLPGNQTSNFRLSCCTINCYRSLLVGQRTGKSAGAAKLLSPRLIPRPSIRGPSRSLLVGTAWELPAMLPEWMDGRSRPLLAACCVLACCVVVCVVGNWARAKSQPSRIRLQFRTKVVGVLHIYSA